MFAIDFSDNVINNMKTIYHEYPINCRFILILVYTGEFDQINNIFVKNQFDLLINKSTIDGIFSKETENINDEIYTLFTKFYYIMKNNSIFLSLSLKNLGKCFLNQRVLE